MSDPAVLRAPQDGTDLLNASKSLNFPSAVIGAEGSGVGPLQR